MFPCQLVISKIDLLVNQLDVRISIKNLGYMDQIFVELVTGRSLLYKRYINNRIIGVVTNDQSEAEKLLTSIPLVVLRRGV